MWRKGGRREEEEEERRKCCEITDGDVVGNETGEEGEG